MVAAEPGLAPIQESSREQVPAVGSQSAVTSTACKEIESISLDSPSNPSIGPGTDIRVTWNGRREHHYRLQELRAPDERIKYATLLNSFPARLTGQNGDPSSPDAPPEIFVLRVPRLKGTSQEGSAHLKERMADAEKVLQQEYDLRRRLHTETITDVLPILYSPAPLDGNPCPAFDMNGMRIPYLAREHVAGKSLRAWVTEHYAFGDNGNREFLGISGQHDWFRVARILLKSLARLHRERAAHGFICPDTIIVPQTKPEQLDDPKAFFKFVNAAGSQLVLYFDEDAIRETKADDLIFPIRRWYDATENLYWLRDRSKINDWMRYVLHEGSDYYSATDIYSVGVTLAFLATGSDYVVEPFDYAKHWLDQRDWQIVRGCQVKRQYHVMKVQILDALEQAARKRGSRGDGQKPNGAKIYEDSLARAEVILQCSRSQLDRRAQSTKHVLTLMESFQPGDSNQSPQPPVLKPWSENLLGPLQEAATQHWDCEGLDLLAIKLAEGKTIPKPVLNLVRHRLASALERIATLQESQSLRVRGSRATISDAFLGAMCALHDGDECVALTTSDFWKVENFAPTSRTSSLLQILRLRGVVLKWIIVLKTSELYMPQVQRILGFRRADDLRMDGVVEDLRKKGIGTAENRRPWQDSYFYAFATDEEHESMLRDKKSFIGLVEKTGPRALSLLIAPDFGARGGTLAALTFWVKPRRGDELLKDFETFEKIARPVRYVDRIL